MIPNDRIDALAFNALGEALSKENRFVALSERQRVASAVRQVVEAEVREQAAQMCREFANSHRDLCAKAPNEEAVRERLVRAETLDMVAAKLTPSAVQASPPEPESQLQRRLTIFDLWDDLPPLGRVVVFGVLPAFLVFVISVIVVLAVIS